MVIMARQLVFAFLDKPPRRKPHRLMHVIDYGSGMAQFLCRRCSYFSGWIAAGKLSDDKRGRPCPRCNPDVSAGGEHG